MALLPPTSTPSIASSPSITSTPGSSTTSPATSSSTTSSSSSTTTSSATSTSTTSSSASSSTSTASSSSGTSTSTSTSATSASQTSSISSTNLGTSTSSSILSTHSSSTQLSTNSQGQVVSSIVIVTVPASATASSSSTSVASNTHESFFQNKGAVGGTFAAVGVVVAIIVAILVTRAVRRRRERQFDREMDEAAREAAGASVPPFLDDDDEPKPYGATAYSGPGSYGHAGGYNAQGDWSSSGQGGVYSDTASHGTYAQPPMSHESYPMHEFSNVAPGAIFDHGGNYPAGGGANIDRDIRTNPSSTAVGDSPYPAFLHPNGGYDNGSGVGPGGYPAMGRGTGGGGGFDNDVVAGGVAGMAGIGRRSSMNNTSLNRMKSQGSSGALSGGTGATPPVPENYPSNYSGPSATTNASGGSSQGHGGFSAGGANFSSAVHDAAFGGHAEQSALPNPFASKIGGGSEEDVEDAYGGYGSEEEQERPKVLKVANE